MQSTHHTCRENPSFHEPFLARAADEDSQGPGDNGLGAFLTLRLVDQFAVDQGRTNRDATSYQIKATGEFLNDIYPCTTEITHLRELVRVSETALSEDDRRLLFAPLLAFAYWLEQELRLEEALDVLTTALRLSDGRDGEEEVAAHLSLGRVERLNGDFAAARISYERCGQMAAKLGDDHSVLLSRIGQAVVLQRVGNLPESEKVLREVLEQARHLGDADAEARACHDLGCTLYFAGRIEHGIPLAFRAYELYPSPVRRMRALSDTGMMLKDVGRYRAAQQALHVVLSGHPPAEVRTNAVLELLELSALVRDRVSFERWRQELTQQRSELSSEQLVDFELKLGTGFAHFARLTQAEEHLQRALTLAEEYGMGERIFHCEQRLRDLQERRAKPADDAALPHSRRDDEPGVLDTLARLDLLAADVLG